jgi:isopenicillin N synthase-like dioxygenase
MSVDWAELVTLDLNLFDKPGGKQNLAEQLTYAAQHVGFFYVKNFDISQEEVDRQFALGREFYDLPLEEKLKFHNPDDLRSGEYNGYRPAGWRQSVHGEPIWLWLTCMQAHGGNKRQLPSVQHSEVRWPSPSQTTTSLAR